MKIVHGTTQGLADVEDFLSRLDRPDGFGSEPASRLFDRSVDIIVTRAPGRLDVMGGIADYSGSLVLELPLAEATLVALQRSTERTIRIVSLGDTSRDELIFDLPLSCLESGGRAIEYESARDYFRSRSEASGAAYIAGAFLVLMRERGIEFPDGARILISSKVPEGKGVSSSAAVEVATMQALVAAYDLEASPREIALLCQKVENLVAGAPCGVMDQMSSVLGQADHLFSLLCQPAEPQLPVPIPDGISFWGLDSGERHSVAGGDYGSVRVGAFMGYRIIAMMAGLKVRDADDRLVQIDDPRWDGYLANIDPAEFEAEFERGLPESIRGSEFLGQFHGTTDPVTRIDPARIYAVRMPTAHPVYENYRTKKFAEILSGTVTDESTVELGELMYASHASYSACGLGSEGTDLLVRLVREAGPARGVYGAKITGGGSGGTVAVLGRSDAGDAVESIAAEYERRTGYRPSVFSGSSPGSAEFGYLQLTPCG
jgi:L-arabinokinase